jgi:hypothetical protein
LINSLCSQSSTSLPRCGARNTRSGQSGDGAHAGSHLLPEIRANQLTAIRSLLETHGTLLLDVGAAIEKLTAEVITSHSERRRIGEMLDRLLRSQTETRRALGGTSLHIPPRHSARRPLGID